METHPQAATHHHHTHQVHTQQPEDRTMNLKKETGAPVPAPRHIFRPVPAPRQIRGPMLTREDKLVLCDVPCQDKLDRDQAENPTPPKSTLATAVGRRGGRGKRWRLIMMANTDFSSSEEETCREMTDSTKKCYDTNVVKPLSEIILRKTLNPPHSTERYGGRSEGRGRRDGGGRPGR